MSRSNCPVKLSGDMIEGPILGWLKEIAAESFTVICVGGGTQINTAFRRAGFMVGEFGPLGRETKTLQERQLARDVLETNRNILEELLAKNDIFANVIIPVLDIGTALCHVNGDQFVLTAYNGYDRIFVVTTTDRVEKKAEQFRPYPKIQVVGF